MLYFSDRKFRMISNVMFSLTHRALYVDPNAQFWSNPTREPPSTWLVCPLVENLECDVWVGTRAITCFLSFTVFSSVNITFFYIPLGGSHFFYVWWTITVNLAMAFIYFPTKRTRYFQVSIRHYHSFIWTLIFQKVHGGINFNRVQMNFEGEKGPWHTRSFIIYNSFNNSLIKQLYSAFWCCPLSCTRFG